jgi:hypothetical protein
MNWLNATNFIQELEILNSQHSDRQIIPVQGTNNTLLVNANLLTDCDDGDYWYDYGNWLKGLPETVETPLPIEPDID